MLSASLRVFVIDVSMTRAKQSQMKKWDEEMVTVTKKGDRHHFLFE